MKYFFLERLFFYLTHTGINYMCTEFHPNLVTGSAWSKLSGTRRPSLQDDTARLIAISATTRRNPWKLWFLRFFVCRKGSSGMGPSCPKIS